MSKMTSSVSGTSAYTYRLSRHTSFASTYFPHLYGYKKVYEYRPPTSNTINAGIITFVAMLFFIISFTSPYWLQSFAYTYSDFKNMGLWEFCFDGFRYPKYQFDRKFTGCDYVYSFEYEIIREWLLPAWLMATQAFMTIALLASVTTLVIVSLLLVRWPLQFIMRYEWHMTGIAFICEATTFVCIFFAVLVFGVMCWTRSWLLNPNFNYLSWSYGFAVIAGALHGFAGLRFLYETFEARDRKREAANTLKQESVENMNMHMHEQHHYI